MGMDFKPGIALQRAGHGVTIHARQLDVEQDQVGADFGGQFEAQRAGHRGNDFVAVLLQEERYHDSGSVRCLR